MKRKRGRPPRLNPAGMSQREFGKAMDADMAPALELASRLRNDPPGRARERYKKAVSEIAAKFGIGVRTVERRATQYRDLVKAMEPFDIPEAQRTRIRNHLKSEIAQGRGGEQASNLARFMQRTPRR